MSFEDNKANSNIVLRIGDSGRAPLEAGSPTIDAIQESNNEVFLSEQTELERAKPIRILGN
jgi:hypothetical protein